MPEPMEIVGADLGGTNFRAGRVTGGILQQTASVPVYARASEGAILDQLYSLLDRVVTPGTKGIGVGVPTVVDLERGIVYETTNLPSWKEVPLKSLLESRYRIPAYVNNDANCFAVGEKHFGKAKGFDAVVGLTLGTGMGAGILVRGRLHAGSNCGAGEFGMIPYLDSDYEHYCSGAFFQRGGMTGEQAFEKASRGDGLALSLFAQLGGHVGAAIKTVLYAVDPEIIVLGGSVSKAFKFFEPAMRESLRSFGFSRTAQRIKIVASDTDNIAILGAAALYLDAQENP